MEREPLTIKRRSAESSVFLSVRVPKSMMKELDTLSAEANLSRNHLINLLLTWALENTELI